MKSSLKIEENKNYKWAIVAASFIMVFTCLGFCSSTKSMYLSQITEALQIRRTLFSFNDSLRFITSAIINLFFGRLVQRLGTRKMVALGFLSLIGSMLVYSVAETIYVFYIGGILLGLGISWTSTTMVGYIVDCWCKEHRGTIMGAILAGNGLGGALAAQVIEPYIYNEADPFAYRDAYRLTAVILLVVGIIVVAVLRDKPANERPAPGHKKKTRGANWSGIEFEYAIRKPYFWLTAVCIFFTGFSLQSVSGISAAHLKDVGFDGSFVAIVVSVHSLALAAFKFLGGVSYDHLGLKKTMLLCNLSAVIMTFLLAIVKAGTVGTVIALAYGILSSASLPLESIMLPLITSDLFGKKSYAKLLGIYVSINTAGYAVGVPAANLCYDSFGTYAPMLYVLSSVMLIVLIAYLFILPASEKERQAICALEDQE